ncbi:hypothetical protein [Burkholderia gladioli]|uniref:hypothetical protein n=1 Tax=Burkholderia gladioli TaxID=28095 RepID=UPI001FC80F58|nr:hypothetical protein [Burkholderia gladioli]
MTTPLTDERRAALSSLITNWFSTLDADGSLIREFDYFDESKIDELIDQAIAPTIADAVECVRAAADVPPHVRFSMESTARWLESGCDPRAAAKEIRASLAKLDAAPAAPVAEQEEMIRFCPECGRLGDIPEGFQACCPDWSEARVVPKRFADLCAETFKLCTSQPFRNSAQAVAADGAALSGTPFANCQFRICDLPGQCKAEGKCHHPRAAVSPATAEQDPTTDEECPDDELAREEAYFRRWPDNDAPATADERAARDDGFFAGVCVALQVITAFDQGVMWAELVRACGTDELLQYAAHVEPEEWQLAGFEKYAFNELRKKKPKAGARASQAAAPAEAGEAGEAVAWTAASDRLPPARKTVIVAVEFDGPGDWRLKAGGINDEGEWCVFGASWTPTHWIEMPPSPVNRAQGAQGGKGGDRG